MSPRRLLAAIALALLAWLLWPPQAAPEHPPDAAPTAAQIERGAYLARAGHCAGCHTARGQAPYAGGRGIATPFGTVYASNLTPEPDTGLGRWREPDFWRALHEGRSRDGHLLSPAFPTGNFSHIARDDARDLWAYLRSLQAVHRPNTPHSLPWPLGTQAALKLWRAAFFWPAPDTAQAPAPGTAGRGAYLVQGLGHCDACHAPRTMLGSVGSLATVHSGQAMPAEPWLAPSLASPLGDGQALGPAPQLHRFLKTGLSDQHAALGPMADVVAGSTQYLRDDDLQAMVAHLLTLNPQAAAAPTATAAPMPAAQLAEGERLYKQHCADCHGAQGQGAPGIYPPLRGSHVVQMPSPANLIRIITTGGFAPGTAGNPRPYGMPAFDLPHTELATLSTWLRQSWGHHATPVTEVDVLIRR